MQRKALTEDDLEELEIARSRHGQDEENTLVDTNILVAS
jgi:hypothetical protein